MKTVAALGPSDVMVCLLLSKKWRKCVRDSLLGILRLRIRLAGRRVGPLDGRKSRREHAFRTAVVVHATGYGRF